MQWWERICKRCGVCCYEKRRTSTGLITDLNAPCAYLDEQTRLCTVYPRRFSVCRECRKMTIFHALFSSYLPDSCGYVETFRIWRRSSRRRPRR